MNLFKNQFFRSMELRLKLDYEGMAHLGVKERDQVLESTKCPFYLKKMIRDKTNHYMR